MQVRPAPSRRREALANPKALVIFELLSSCAAVFGDGPAGDDPSA
jgi:hypothetical protein